VAGEVSLAQFMVLMDEFAAAIDVVAKQSTIVGDTLDGIGKDLSSVATYWTSPAAATFEPLRLEFQKSSDDLNEVLVGILQRMRTSYGNYLDTETKAVQNLTAQQPNSDGGAGPQTANADASNGPATDRSDVGGKPTASDPAQLTLRSGLLEGAA